MNRSVTIMLGFGFGLLLGTLRATAAPSPASNCTTTCTGDPDAVALVFKDNASAWAFYTWWVTEGRDNWGASYGSLDPVYSPFSPNHQASYGDVSEEISYE